MKDQDKTQQQLIAELTELRQRVAALEGAEVERMQTCGMPTGSYTFSGSLPTLRIKVSASPVSMGI